MNRKSVILAAIGSGLICGYIYNFNIPQALQTPLRNQPYNFTTNQFNLIFFFTFLPTILFDIPIGFWMGHISLKLSMSILLSLSLACMIIIAIMFQFLPSGYIFVVMAMRAIFGMAGQAGFTGLGLFIEKYSTSSFEMVMGLCFTIPFLFDSVNSVVSTTVYNLTQSLPLPWFIGCIFGLISVLSVLLMSREINKQQAKISEKLLKAEEEKLKNPQACNQSLQQQQEQFKCSDIKNLGKKFWILLFTIFFTQGCSSPFMDNLNELIVKRFSIPYLDSGRLLLIPYTCLAIFAFLIGSFIIKKPDWRRTLFLLSSLLFSAMMLFFYLMPNTTNPTFIEYIMTLSFYLAVNYSNLYTQLPLIVSRKALGTAYGFFGVSIGGCQAIIPILNTYVMNLTDDLVESYNYLTLFGFFITLIPLSLAIYIQKSSLFDCFDMTLIQHNKKQNTQTGTVQ